MSKTTAAAITMLIAVAAAATLALSVAGDGSQEAQAPRIGPAAVAPEAGDTVWFDDALPAGAQTSSAWNWVSSDPGPISGAKCHVSPVEPGLHLYAFEGATDSLSFKPGEEFFIHVYLDPANPPRQIMLQFDDGNWEHRAYWGENLIDAGVVGTASRRYMGPLPAAGEWVRLEVPTWRVGLQGASISGLAITMFDGRAAWDCAGKSEKSLYFPTGAEWATTSFADEGWDGAGTLGLLAYLALTGTRTFLVLKDGKILMENYWEGWDKDTVHPLYSATKGFISLHVGNAQHRGELGLSDKVNDHLGAGWSNATPAQEAAITVRHLVTMSSGLDDDLKYEAAPGTKWRYAAPYGKLHDILAAATGKTDKQLTQEELVAPLGMENTAYVDGSSWVDCTNRDAARYGLMMLAGGQWNGNSIVHDKKYLAAAINTSQEMNPTYGYLWWLNGKSASMVPGDEVAVPGPLMPDAPAEAYVAAGAFHQYVVPVPSHDLVIVRMGSFNFVPVRTYLNEIVKGVLAMAPNSAPLVSDVTDQTVGEDASTDLLAFEVSDRDCTGYALTVTATSSNPALVPEDNLELSGEGERRFLTATPLPDAHGTTTITVTAADSRGASSSDSFVLTVRPMNDRPVADFQDVATAEDTPAAITLTGDDVDGDALDYVIVSGPANGTLSGTAPNLTYTPAENYAGADSFTFKVDDGELDSATVTVSITVTPVNDAPVADAQSLGTPYETPTAITLTASDAEDSPLNFAVTSGPSHGTLSGTAPGLTYTPDPGYSGPDSFDFKVDDGELDSAPATVSITVTPANRVPEISAHAPETPFSMDAGSSQVFQVWAEDEDGDPLTYSWRLDGAQTGETASSFSYSPAADDAGVHALEVTVSDGRGGSAEFAWEVRVMGAGKPELSVSAETMTAGCTQGSNAATLSFTVCNSGGGELEYEVGDDVDWLSCSPASGSSVGEEDTITITFSTDGLAAGVYSAEITVVEAEADTESVTVPVTLTVTAAGSPKKSKKKGGGGSGGGGGGGGGGCVALGTPGADPLSWALPYLGIAAAWSLSRLRRARRARRT